MRVPPQARLLPEGRLHLQHGPIDLMVMAEGRDPLRHREGSEAIPSAGRPPLDCFVAAAPRNDERRETAGAMHRGGSPHPAGFAGDPPPAGEGSNVFAAYQAAATRFARILDELCAELPALRRPARPDRTDLTGPIARRMWAAVAPFAADAFITPMAAVAGAVAEDVLAAMTLAAPLARASVNNGGDIALHLAPRESLRVGLVDRPDRPGLFGTTTIRANDPVRGVATSGWRGRSFSLGIADAVTVLARTSAEADAAATIISNAVDLPGHSAIMRVPACEVQSDSDLGQRLVTRGLGALSDTEVAEALARGAARARELIREGRIVAAALHLQGRTVTVESEGLVHSRRLAEKAPDLVRSRLEARATAGACFETRLSASLLSRTPGLGEVGRQDIAA